MLKNANLPHRIVNSVAPIRICDNGGWTDTWFARHGKIFNIGVYPYAEVQVEVFLHDGERERIVIYAENYGQKYVMHPENLGWDKHPLLEAAIKKMNVPAKFAFQVTIFSEAPAGASTGTSAAVTVALIGALNCLTPGRMTPHEIAAAAHFVETEMLKQQCGIQDQLCSAYGGLNYIEMDSYPHATVTQIQLPNPLWWELERRLVLIFLGKSHSSSEIHKTVIRELENAGPENAKMNALRRTAEASRDAVAEGRFDELGRLMIDNTNAQTDLHPGLVSADAQTIINIAREHGAVGWKVNGAGGDGGSLTILTSPLSSAKRSMIREIEAENPLFKNMTIYLSRFGLRTWETVPS